MLSREASHKVLSLSPTWFGESGAVVQNVIGCLEIELRRLRAGPTLVYDLADGLVCHGLWVVGRAQNSSDAQDHAVI